MPSEHSFCDVRKTKSGLQNVYITNIRLTLETASIHLVSIRFVRVTIIVLLFEIVFRCELMFHQIPVHPRHARQAYPLLHINPNIIRH